MQFVKSIALVAVVVAGVNAQAPMINTPPSVVQCQPAALTWSGGQGPYFLSVLPGGQQSAPPLEDLGMQAGTSFTWNVDIASGTAITLQVRDSSGAIGLSGIVTIQSSSDSSCIGKNSQSSSGTGAPSSTGGSSSSAASGSSSSAASTSAGSTTAPATSSKPSTPASSSPAASTPTPTKPASTSGGPSASSPAPTNGASGPFIPGSVASILAALLAVVIA